MKRSAFLLMPAFFGMILSCEQTKTTTVDANGNSTTVETVGFDKQRIDSTAEKVENATQRAAEKTGDALQDAGEKIKENVNKSSEQTNKTVTRDTVQVNKTH